MIYLLLMIFSLFLIGFTLCYVGEKLLKLSANNAFVYNAQGLTSKHAKNPLKGKLLGFLLGLLTFDAGVFAYMNNRISLDSAIDPKEKHSLIEWNIVGQYFFILLLFSPLYVYAIFVILSFILMLWIDRTLFPHTMSLVLGQILLKCGTFVLFFGINFFNQNGMQFIFSSLVPYLQTIYVPLLIGLFLGYLFKSLIMPLIIMTFLIYATGVPYILGLVFLVGLHLGKAIHYGQVSRQLQETAAEFTFTNCLIHAYLVCIFLLGGLLLYFKNTPWELSKTISFPLAGFVLSLIGIVIISFFGTRTAIKSIPSKGRKYYFPAGFSNSFAGARIFGRELSRIISPVINRTITQRYETSDLHNFLENRFKEMKFYEKKMVVPHEHTLTSQQMLALTNIFQNIVRLNDNLQRRAILIQKEDFPKELKAHLLQEKNKVVQWNDPLMTTYISILQDPKESNAATLQNVTQRLCEHLNGLREGMRTWCKTNLKNLSNQQEEVVLEYLLLYESDASLIKNMSILWQQWVQLTRNYHHPRLEYQ